MFKDLLNNFSAIFTSPLFWGVLSTIILSAIVVYLIIRWKRNDYYHIGYIKGKKTARLMKHQLKEFLDNKNKDRSVQQQVQEVKNQVFDAAFPEEITVLKNEIQNLETKISNTDNKFNLEEERIKQEYEKERDALKNKLTILEQQEQEQRKGLSEIQHEESVDQSQNQTEEKLDSYHISRFMYLVKNQVSIAFRRLEDDMLWWGLIGIIGLLLAGDYFITYDIFNDLLRRRLSDNPEFIFIASGLIALVFLVLVDLGLEYFKKKGKKEVDRLIKIGSWVLGLLLGMAYMLIIGVSVLQESANIQILTDTILRILFFPLIVAAAVLIQKIRSGPGFSILITPFKVIILSLTLLFAIILLPVEVMVRSLRKRRNDKYKPGLQAEKKQLQLEEIQKQITNIKQQLHNLEQWKMRQHRQLDEKTNQQIQELEQKKNSAQSKLDNLRRGSDEAVLTVLEKQ